MANDLTLEKMRIGERLVSIEATLKAQMELEAIRNKHFEEFNKRILENVDKLNYIIIGNGTKGIAETVRILEESEEKRKKHLTFIYTGIGGAWLAGIGNKLIEWFSK